jgi:hypothetical protein
VISHEALFLGAADLPGLRLVQDARARGPDPGDKLFAKHGGTTAGMCVWMAGDVTAPVWRVVDIRWRFATESDAAAYHAAALSRNREQAPRLPEACPGTDGYVFGGPRPEPLLGVDMIHLFFVFRVGTVVVKVYVAGGPQAAEPLTPALARPLAEHAAARAAEGVL